jgi:hypothetical protein
MNLNKTRQCKIVTMSLRLSSSCYMPTNKHDKAKGRNFLTFVGNAPKKQIQRRSGIQLNNVYIKFNFKNRPFSRKLLFGKCK